MKSVQVKVKSSSPMLMHRFFKEEATTSKKKDRVYNSEDDAKKAAYYDEKIGYYIPSTHFEGSLREAAKNFNQKGKKTYKETMLASVFIDQEAIPLNKEYDEIDCRPVVIQRNRIVRSRPKWNSWTVSFQLNYDESRIDSNTLKDILVEAGLTKGVGDYRPKFGRFIVEEFKEIK